MARGAPSGEAFKSTISMNLDNHMHSDSDIKFMQLPTLLNLFLLT